MVNSVYSAIKVNAGKVAGSEQRSVVDAGIYSHSGGVGAVPVMNFGAKVATLTQTQLPPKISFSSDFGQFILKVVKMQNFHMCQEQGCGAGAGADTFWPEPEPPKRFVRSRLRLRKGIRLWKNNGMLTAKQQTAEQTDCLYLSSIT